jgi:hypothetical protein
VNSSSRGTAAEFHCKIAELNNAYFIAVLIAVENKRAHFFASSNGVSRGESSGFSPQFFFTMIRQL